MKIIYKKNVSRGVVRSNFICCPISSDLQKSLNRNFPKLNTSYKQNLSPALYTKTIKIIYKKNVLVELFGPILFVAQYRVIFKNLWTENRKHTEFTLNFDLRIALLHNQTTLHFATCRRIYGTVQSGEKHDLHLMHCTARTQTRHFVGTVIGQCSTFCSVSA